MIDETENVEVKKVNMEGVPEQLVFGLDIGTRSIVGTIRYKGIYRSCTDIKRT